MSWPRDTMGTWPRDDLDARRPALGGRTVSTARPSPALAEAARADCQQLRAGVELLTSAWVQLEDADVSLRRIQAQHVEPLAGSDREDLGRARVKLAEAQQAVQATRAGLAALLSRVRVRWGVGP